MFDFWNPRWRLDQVQARYESKLIVDPWPQSNMGEQYRINRAVDGYGSCGMSEGLPRCDAFSCTRAPRKVVRQKPGVFRH